MLFRAVVLYQIHSNITLERERVAWFDVFWLMPVMIYIQAASNKIQQYLLTFPAAPRCQLESNLPNHPRGQEHCLYLKSAEVWVAVPRSQTDLIHLVTSVSLYQPMLAESSNQ